MHALDSDEKLSVLLEFVLVSENDLGEGGASARVVHDVLHDSLYVPSHVASLNVSKRDFRRKLAWSTYPLRSAKSRVLKAAGATLFEVWALKIVLPPRL